MSRKLSDYIAQEKSIETEGKEHVDFDDLVDVKIVLHQVSKYEKDGLQKYMWAFTMNGVECYTVASASVVVTKMDQLAEKLKDEEDWDLEITVVQKTSKKSKKQYYDII